MESQRHERGMALISGLLLLLVMTIIGIGMFRSFGIQARIAGNTREKQRALHTAEGAQTYAEWWLSSNAGAHATAGSPCTGPLKVSANTTQVCSNPLAGVATNSVGTVPWLFNGAEVGVEYTPPGLNVTSGQPDQYFRAPVFYINYVTGSYDKRTGTQSSSYQIDATGYGGTSNTVAVVESSYRVSVTYTTQDSKSKFYSLTGP